MADFTTNKVSGDQLAASEWNQLADVDNFITSSSQTPATGDLDQIAKAAAVYAGQGGIYCTDSGVADAYVVAQISPLKAPPVATLKIGTTINFRPGNDNTGACTVNAFSHGVKNIKLEDGSTNPSAGDLSTTRDIKLVWDGTVWRISLVTTKQATTTTSGKSFLPSRITIAVNSGDEDHDIDCSAGNFIFDDNSGQAVASALTKRIDAAWGAGDNEGGLDTGSVANNTFYYVFPIYNPTTETADFLFSTSKTNPTLPSGYTKQKRVGALRTDGSANIRPFDQMGNKFVYRTYIEDRALAATPSSPTNQSITVPPDTIALNNLHAIEIGGATAIQILFCSTNNDNLNASTTNFTMKAGTPGGNQQSWSQSVETKVDSSSNVNIDANSTDFNLQVLTTGYVDWELTV